MRKKTAPPSRVTKVAPPPARFALTAANVLVPERLASRTVPSTKLLKGLKAAKKQIEGAIDELASIMTNDYHISEIEISVSFDADGKFLGFGVGGAASVKVTIKPRASS
ncbi:MAG TPA: hypothetical protein VMT19_11935 [Thermoanaerobaculaceae bacterium]|nr:hypothetical protein [Thermoanaerobaculaceae bacterium]